MSQGAENAEKSTLGDTIKTGDDRICLLVDSKGPVAGVHCPSKGPVDFAIVFNTRCRSRLRRRTQPSHTLQSRRLDFRIRLRLALRRNRCPNRC